MTLLEKVNHWLSIRNLSTLTSGGLLAMILEEIERRLEKIEERIGLDD